MHRRGLFESSLLTDSDHHCGRVARRNEFFDRVGRELVEATDPPAGAVTRSVFELLCRHVTRGEIDDIVGMLPESLRELWPRAEQGREASTPVRSYPRSNVHLETSPKP